MFERIQNVVAVVSIGLVTCTTPALAAGAMAASETVLNCGPEISGATADRPRDLASVSRIPTEAVPRLRDLMPVRPVGLTVRHERAPHPTLRPRAAGGWKDASLTVKVWSIVGAVVIVGIVAASMND